jgi:hypothetical protein
MDTDKASKNAPIVFEWEKSPSHSKRILVNSLIIIAITIFLGIQAWPFLKDGFALSQNNPTQILSDLVKIIIPLIVAGLIASFVFFIRRTHRKFIVAEEGVYVGNKKYLWDTIKNFHMLGDSQDERTGLGGIRLTGGYDPVNPYKGLRIYVLQLKGLLKKTVRLQVSSKKTEEFEAILMSHTISRETSGHMYRTGINKWFIILFVVPFSLLILSYLYQLLMPN